MSQSRFNFTNLLSVADPDSVTKFLEPGQNFNWETVSQEFSLNPVHFLKWCGVLKSVPSSWKKTLKGYNTENNILSEEESHAMWN